MVPPRPHLGRLTVAAVLALALPLTLALWGGDDPSPSDALGPQPAILAGAVPSTTAQTATGGWAPAAPSSSAPQARTLGDDPVLDDLWHRCEQGSGAACDQLFEQAPSNSEYESFGLSCGNRPDVLRCAQEMDAPSTTVPPPTLPTPMSVPSTAPPLPTTTAAAGPAAAGAAGDAGPAPTSAT